MADIATLESALRKADAAGDTYAAGRFAQEIRTMRSTAPPDPAALAKEAAASLPYKMGQAGAQPAQSFPSYAAQSLIEGAPSTAGAIMGTPGGIPGMAAGAAVGETLRQAAKSLTHPSIMPGVSNRLDMNPVYTTAALTAAIPSALVGTSKVAGALKDKFLTPVMDLFKEGGEKDLATKFITNKLLSPEALSQSIEAAKNVTELVPGHKPTMAQVMAHIPGGSPLQAHQATIAKSPLGVSGSFGEREAKQRVAEEIAARYANEMTVPKGMEALSRANESGQINKVITGKQRVLDALIEKQQNILRTPPVSRTNLTPSDELKSAVDLHAPYAPKPLLSQKEMVRGQYGMEQVAKGQAQREAATSNLPALQTTKEVLEQVRPQAVRADSIIGSINKLSSAELEGSPVSTKALESVKEHLAQMADKNGIIDARTLYQFKKEGLDQVVDAAFEKTSPKVSEKFRAKNLIQVKNMIDDAIEQGGGTGWKDYLKDYAGRMQNVEEAIASREGQYNPLQKTNLADPEVGKLQIANVLDRPISYINAALRHFRGDVQPRLHAEFQHLYQDPKYYAQQMEHVPLRYRPMVEALLKQAGGVTGAQMGAQIAHTP